MDREISVRELNDRQKAGKAPVMLDVREDFEREASTLPGSKHIRLGELPNRYKSLDPGVEVVVFCQSGSRPSPSVDYLRAQGYPKARNLTGGLVQ